MTALFCLGTREMNLDFATEPLRLGDIFRLQPSIGDGLQWNLRAGLTFGIPKARLGSGNKTFGSKIHADAITEVLPDVKDFRAELSRFVIDCPILFQYIGAICKGVFDTTQGDGVEAELSPKEAFKLGRICQILKDNPDAKIVIKGYADSATGSTQRNNELSEERANAVAEMLRSEGIAPGRISIEYTGGDRDASASPADNRVAVCIVK